MNAKPQNPPLSMNFMGTNPPPQQNTMKFDSAFDQKDSFLDLKPSNPPAKKLIPPPGKVQQKN